MKKIALGTVSIIVWLAICATCWGAPAPAPPSTPPPAEAPTEAPEATPAPAWPEVFKVGTLQPMTGGGAFYGHTMGGGLELALRHINEDGELPFRLEMITVDHKGGDAIAGMAGIRKLLDVDQVNIIAASWPNISLIAQEAASEVHMPVFNGGGIAPDLVNLPYLHNTRLLGDQEGLPVVYYMVEEWGCTKPAMIYWNDPGGKEIADAAKTVQEELGFTIVADEPHELFKDDYSAELARIKAAGADCMFIWSMGADVGKVAKQALEMGIRVPMGTVIMIDPEAIAIAGHEPLNGMIVSTDYYDAEADLPCVTRLEEGYREWRDEEPDFYVANYYEIGWIIFDTIKYVLDNGGDPFDPQQLEDAIQEKEKFTSCYGDGTLELLDSGGVVKEGAIFQYQDGDLNLLEVYTPPPVGEWFEFVR